MAIVQRVHGDAEPVVNFDVGSLVATGLTKNPTAYNITLAAAGDETTGGNVEATLRALQVAATVVMYQNDNTQLSVLVEAQGFGSDAAVLTALGSLATAVSSVNGFKLA